MRMGKVCFDFDGVIHSYTSGFLGDEIIPDPPVPGIKQVIDRLRDAGYQVVVLSSRSATQYGREAMREWFDRWGITIDGIYATKPPARCYVDDRAVPFDGDTSKLFDIIDNFEPWWKDETETEYDHPPQRMMGAIVGDIVGSVYEFDNIHTEDFPLFRPDCTITDDSIMTIAVAQAILNSDSMGTPLSEDLVGCMQSFGRQYPSSYGGKFSDWLWSDDPKPYNSWGNGAPMRCSPVGWVADDVEEAKKLGEATALPTHNHPDAVKAAGTTAALICLARDGIGKADLKSYVLNRGYKLSTIDKLRVTNEFTEKSTPTMNAALSCFFASNSFEDCIRKAISIGGDSDTIAAIAGSIAEAYFGIPSEILDKAWQYVPEELRPILHKFNRVYQL